ncbi:hypothetical protein EV562_108308 [Streptomyces sp. BK208]|uniref:hypothetical protein n=1 Tax=Streptomyces sp. BK208 TaxID=2512150 RepID=UPI00105B6AD4|nr:hypothetical protein [Streptomyces sp. BK208]TDT36480.1 hypothetical protein EV562_108308 [Streptomyces sp. BK208]
MIQRVTVPGLFPPPACSHASVVEASPLGAGPHSSTLLGVVCLGCPGPLVEITATAGVPEGGRP